MFLVALRRVKGLAVRCLPGPGPGGRPGPRDFGVLPASAGTAGLAWRRGEPCVLPGRQHDRRRWPFGALAGRGPGQVEVLHHPGTCRQLPRGTGPGGAPGTGVRPGHRRTGAVGRTRTGDRDLVPARAKRPQAVALRTALYQHAFNPARPAADVTTARILDWVQQASLPVARLADPMVLRQGLVAEHSRCGWMAAALRRTP
jgi:hypothetical protein